MASVLCLNVYYSNRDGSTIIFGELSVSRRLKFGKIGYTGEPDLCRVGRRQNLHWGTSSQVNNNFHNKYHDVADEDHNLDHV